MEEKPIKITFGIQPKMLKRIEELSKYWDDVRDRDDKDSLPDGWIKYDRSFWEKLGEEFGWEPLTLTLHYFKHLNKVEKCPTVKS